MPSLLGYWDIRGLAHPIRMLLSYVGEDYKDDLYVCGPGPEYNRDSWLSVKHTKGLDFPNLPYYISEDGVKLVQSNAICRHLGRKYDLYGKDEKERAAVDMMAEQSMDFRNALVRVCYNPKAKELLPDYLKSLKDSLTNFEKYLGDKKFFVGDSVTFVDFIMYELLDQNRLLFKDSLQGFPKINQFLERFEDLPKNKPFLSSPKYAKFKCNNRMAVYM